jgi:hypothetical protein
MLEKPEGMLHKQSTNTMLHVVCRPSGTQLTVNRRTGITLAEGKRDEHGMEEVDGIFSSPEKSPLGDNGLDTSESIGSDMSMDEGNCSPNFRNRNEAELLRQRPRPC